LASQYAKEIIALKILQDERNKRFQRKILALLLEKSVRYNIMGKAGISI